MNKYLWAIVATMALVCLGLVPRSSPADDKPPAGDKSSFKMEEISILDQSEDTAGGMPPMYRGVTVQLSPQPAKEVKAYPKLNSKHPLYGTLGLNGYQPMPAGMPKYHFVLDQSPEAVKAAAKAAEKDSSDESEKPAKRPAARPAATAQYDLLYFDANHDLDLTNDGVVHMMKEQPKAARLMGNAENSQAFEPVKVSLGKDQSARLVPIIWNYGPQIYGGSRFMSFMASTARQGEVRLGKNAYKATLSQPNGMLGRMDVPSASLTLTPVDGPKRPQPYAWMNTLGMMREVDGEYYSFSASPSGDRLSVSRYTGDRGVLELSAGTRDIKEMGLTGILQFKGSYFPLGDVNFGMSADKARVTKYRLPVGDYQAMFLSVDYGHLQVGLRSNYSAPCPAGKCPGPSRFARTSPMFSISRKRRRCSSSPRPRTRSSSRARPCVWPPCWRFRPRACSSRA